MISTTVDPGAIDLEPIRNYRGGDRVFDTAAIIDLIAAVEALRDHVASLFNAIRHGDAEHETWLEQAITDHFAGHPVERPRGKGNREVVEALRVRVATAEALEESAGNDAERAIVAANKAVHDLKCLEESTVDSKAFAQLKDRAEAAEARAVEVTGALEDITKGASKDEISINQEVHIFRLAQWRWCQERARAALVAMPDDALERARAIDRVCHRASLSC